MEKQITKSKDRELDPGDMVKFDRGLYSHYAIYEGDGKVIHLAGENGQRLSSGPQHSLSLGGKRFNKARVQRDDLSKVSGNSTVYKHNDDTKIRPLPKHKIVERARASIGQTGYNILTRNCEHFTNWCRYDTSSSSQADVVVKVAIGLTVVFAVAVFCYLWWG